MNTPLPPASPAYVRDLLEILADYQAQRDAAVKRVEADPWATGVIGEYAKVQQQIADATMEFDASIAAVRTSIEQQVLELGASVKGDSLMAVWTKPRVTYDGKILEGFILAHPELAAARHVGQPSVSIRPVGK